MLTVHNFFFFFFNDTATTEIYTLSLHDALPISSTLRCPSRRRRGRGTTPPFDRRIVNTDPGGFPIARPMPLIDSPDRQRDRKSTRLNSSHANISYAVFCLKKKKTYILNIDNTI